MSDSNDLLNKIYDKVEKIDDKVAAIDVTTVKQQSILDEHIRRTVVLENRTDRIFEELKPLKERATLVDNGVKIVIGGGKLVAALSGLALTILGILKFFHKI